MPKRHRWQAKYVALVFALLLLVYSLSCAPSATPQLARVIDGDTIAVSISGKEYKVRYIGIDTPERDSADPELRFWAEAATRHNKELLSGKTIRLEKDTSEMDKYGRLLRYVYADDTLVNAELVRQGLAWAKAYPPDTRYQEYLEVIEEEARQAGRGMWGKIP